MPPASSITHNYLQGHLPSTPSVHYSYVNYCQLMQHFNKLKPTGTQAFSTYVMKLSKTLTTYYSILGDLNLPEGVEDIVAMHH